MEFLDLTYFVMLEISGLQFTSQALVLVFAFSNILNFIDSINYKSPTQHKILKSKCLYFINRIPKS